MRRRTMRRRTMRRRRRRRVAWYGVVRFRALERARDRPRDLLPPSLVHFLLPHPPSKAQLLLLLAAAGQFSRLIFCSSVSFPTDGRAKVFPASFPQI